MSDARERAQAAARSNPDHVHGSYWWYVDFHASERSKICIACGEAFDRESMTASDVERAIRSIVRGDDE